MSPQKPLPSYSMLLMVVMIMEWPGEKGRWDVMAATFFVSGKPSFCKFLLVRSDTVFPFHEIDTFSLSLKQQVSISDRVQWEQDGPQIHARCLGCG